VKASLREALEDSGRSFAELKTQRDVMKTKLNDEINAVKQAHAQLEKENQEKENKLVAVAKELENAKLWEENKESQEALDLVENANVWLQGDRPTILKLKLTIFKKRKSNSPHRWTWPTQR
jgi:hypothetical protein